jgi:hypothetical protein
MKQKKKRLEFGVFIYKMVKIVPEIDCYRNIFNQIVGVIDYPKPILHDDWQVTVK